MSAVGRFSAADHAERRQRAKSAFERHDVDTVLVLGAHNWYRDHAVRYLTGYDCPETPTLLHLPIADGSPALIVTKPDEAERAATITAITDVRADRNPFGAFVRLLSEGPPPRRLGVAGGECMGFSAVQVLPTSLNDALRAHFPQLELVDVGGTLLKLRAIREDREIEVLREAARISDIGANAFFATMRAGVSERDLWSEIWYAMQCAGADDVHMSLCCGPRSFWPHPPSDSVFSPGDIVSVELSPRVEGYFSQSNRMCFVGEDNREWRDLSTLATDALKIAVGSMRPGIAARNVVADVNAFVSRTQLATMDIGGVHRIGHGCGLCVDEGPFLTSASNTELQTNMTMALHPILYLPYRHSMLMLGDYIRISENGVDVMTTPQTEIRVV